MKKRIIAVLLMVVISLTVFASCGEKRVCSFCGQEKDCTVKQVLGAEVAVCDDCLNQLQNGF